VAGSEASVHFELLENDVLYVALTLPNVSVGSVGGGTWLPKQTQARLAMMIDSGAGGDGEDSKIDFDKSDDIGVGAEYSERLPKAQDLAAAAGLAALAGEVSGLAALTTNTLASAHAKLGRSK
jgi:hydroxymethylglutaryl-CoA reductase (NADPH)